MIYKAAGVEIEMTTFAPIIGQKEKSNQTIANELNDNGFRTRKNCEWNRNVIREIIRNKKSKKG